MQRLYRKKDWALNETETSAGRPNILPERIRATEANQAWSLDFMADQLTDGRRFRVLTIVDVFTRESLAVEAGPSLKGTDVVEVLNRIRAERGIPKMLFCDNGSEFSSQIMDLWAYQNAYRLQPARETH
jgi:putative transposase